MSVCLNEVVTSSLIGAGLGQDKALGPRFRCRAQAAVNAPFIIAFGSNNKHSCSTRLRLRRKNSPEENKCSGGQQKKFHAFSTSSSRGKQNRKIHTGPELFILFVVCCCCFLPLFPGQGRISSERGSEKSVWTKSRRDVVWRQVEFDMRF